MESQEQRRWHDAVVLMDENKDEIIITARAIRNLFSGVQRVELELLVGIVPDGFQPESDRISKE